MEFVERLKLLLNKIRETFDFRNMRLNRVIETYSEETDELLISGYEDIMDIDDMYEYFERRYIENEDY